MDIYVPNNGWILLPFSTVVHLACNSLGCPTQKVAGGHCFATAICKSGPPVLRSWLACSEFPVFRSISALHSPRRCCLSDNLQRATGQCLRDIWPQQQQRQRTGRLFSRSVTTERRFNFEARRVLALTVRSHQPPSVASRGWPGEHHTSLVSLPW